MDILYKKSLEKMEQNGKITYLLSKLYNFYKLRWAKVPIKLFIICHSKRKVDR